MERHDFIYFCHRNAITFNFLGGRMLSNRKSYILALVKWEEYSFSLLLLFHYFWLSAMLPPHCFYGDFSDRHKIFLSIGSPLIGDSSFHLSILLYLHVVFSSKCKTHHALMQLAGVSLKMPVIMFMSGSDVLRDRLLSGDH